MKKAPLNFAWPFYLALNELLRDKDLAAASGDLWLRWRLLKAIYLKVSFELSSKEKDGGSDLVGVRSMLQKARRLGDSGRNAPEGYEWVYARRFEEALDEIDERLSELMDRHDMIFSNVQPPKDFAPALDRYKDVNFNL